MIIKYGLTNYVYQSSKLIRCNMLKSAQMINDFFPPHLLTQCCSRVHRTASLFWILLSGAYHVRKGRWCRLLHLNGRDLFSIVALCSDVLPPVRLLHCDRMGTHMINTLWMYDNTRRIRGKTVWGQGTCVWGFVCTWVVFAHDCAFYRAKELCVCRCASGCVCVCVWFKEQCIRLKATPGWER